jgi:hypothetical protein
VAETSPTEPESLLPPDGRQSERALAIRRGTQRLLGALGHASLPEVPLASGRRADLLAVSSKGDIWIIEIKSSVEDFRADSKWPDYRQHCDRLFFATSPEVPPEIFPVEAGLIVADAFGGELARDAPVHALHASTRKELLSRMARTAAARLQALADPAGAAGLPAG